MNLVLIKVSSFLSIIIAGMLAGRTGKLGRRTGEAISKIVFNFTLPAAIVHAFGSANFTPDMLLLVPLGLICALCPYLITYVVTRHSSHDDRILYLMNISGFNIGSFGLPFVQAFFPASTVVAACMFDAGNALMRPEVRTQSLESSQAAIISITPFKLSSDDFYPQFRSTPTLCSSRWRLLDCACPKQSLHLLNPWQMPMVFSPCLCSDLWSASPLMRIGFTN